MKFASLMQSTLQRNMDLLQKIQPKVKRLEQKLLKFLSIQGAILIKKWLFGLLLRTAKVEDSMTKRNVQIPHDHLSKKKQRQKSNNR